MKKLHIGDSVTRMLAGTIPITLVVTNIQDGVVTCDMWEFDELTGAEIDDDLNWGAPPKMTGSYILAQQ